MKGSRYATLIIIIASLAAGSGCIAGRSVEPTVAPVEPVKEDTPESEKNSHWTFLWVKNERANLREGPGTEYYIITPIVKGARLIMMAKQGEWYQVNLRSASINGWIHESVVSEEEVPRED